VTDAFAKLCESETVMQLMAQIETNINEQEELNDPHTYRCGNCRDEGTLMAFDKSRLGDTVAVAHPCRCCTLGAGIERQRARDRFHGQRTTATVNRLLTDVERGRMSGGDYSFLEDEA